MGISVGTTPEMGSLYSAIIIYVYDSPRNCAHEF